MVALIEQASGLGFAVLPVAVSEQFLPDHPLAGKAPDPDLLSGHVIVARPVAVTEFRVVPVAPEVLLVLPEDEIGLMGAEVVVPVQGEIPSLLVHGPGLWRHVAAVGHHEAAGVEVLQVLSGADRAAVYRALADVERRRGDDAALRRALEQQVAYSDEQPSISCLLELASLQSDAGEDELALALLQRGLELAPEDALVVEALSETLARLERHEDLVECLERRAALAATDPTTCASVLGELGAVYEERLGNIESARSAYERAMQADPASPSVAASLERIYRKAEAWDPLRELLGQLGRSGPREQRPTSLCKLGALLLERFEDREGAARAFEAALALDRTCGPAHRGRQRLATEAGDEDAILEAYESEAAVATERSRIAFLIRELMPILEGRDQPEKALDWAKHWIAAAPENAEALRVGARLHEQLDHDTELMALLERLDPLLQRGEQAANRRRMAGLHAARGRREEAIAAYPEIHRELRLALQSVGRKLGMYLRRRKRVRHEGERRNVFLRYLGEVAKAVSDINDVDRDALYEQLLRVAKKTTSDADVVLDDRGRPVEENAQDFGNNVLIVDQSRRDEKQ